MGILKSGREKEHGKPILLMFMDRMYRLVQESPTSLIPQSTTNHLYPRTSFSGQLKPSGTAPKLQLGGIGGE
jgi:hypothetical protein